MTVWLHVDWGVSWQVAGRHWLCSISDPVSWWPERSTLLQYVRSLIKQAQKHKIYIILNNMYNNMQYVIFLKKISIICVCVCVCVCACVRACVHACVRACVIYIHCIYIYIYIHIYIYIYIYIYNYIPK